MKLTLNKKALKNLSKDSQILPADITPQVGGGVTFTCGTVACTEESVDIACNTDVGCGSVGCDTGGGVTWLCGYSANCVSGFCGTGRLC